MSQNPLREFYVIEGNAVRVENYEPNQSLTISQEIHPTSFPSRIHGKLYQNLGPSSYHRLLEILREEEWHLVSNAIEETTSGYALDWKGNELPFWPATIYTTKVCFDNEVLQHQQSISRQYDDIADNYLKYLRIAQGRQVSFELGKQLGLNT